MATRSTIAMEQPDGRVMQIYCHWDGYLGHNGRILDRAYQDRAKVYALMLLGDLISLGSEIGEPHDPNQTQGPVREQCTAFGRDRGERDCHARVFKNYDDYVDRHQYEEYEYIYRQDGVWYVSHGGDYGPLAPTLEKVDKEAV